MPLPRVPFIALRHGETDWNKQGRLQGIRDIPLNDTGIRQALAAKARLAQVPLAAVVTSDLTRALATARIIAEGHGLAAVTDARLREKDYGGFAGRLREEVRAELIAAGRITADEPLTRALPPDAEQPIDTWHRTRAALRDALAAHPQGNVLIVTHNGPLREMLRHLGHRPDGLTNATPYLFKPSLDGWTVQEIPDAT